MAKREAENSEKGRAWIDRIPLGEAAASLRISLKVPFLL
jgi:hypothetical protein